MSGDDFVASKFDSTSLQSLSSENTTISAIVFSADNWYNFVHGPVIKIFVAQYHQRKILCLLIPFNSLQWVISIPLDSLIDGKHEKVHSVFVLSIKLVKNMSHYCRVFTSTGADCNFIALLKEIMLYNTIVNLIFELDKKALLTYCFEIFWSFY